MSLPERRQPDEDAYLARMQAASAEEVVEAVDAAFAARRPLLAARLVQLLDHDDLPEDASLTRALRVAAMMVVRSDDLPNGEWSALEEAWRQARSERMWRIRKRMRASQNLEGGGRIGRLDGRRGRRRRS